MDKIEEWIKEKEDITFINSWQNDEIVEKGLFFYHIPKTGGISFFQALVKSIFLASQGGVLNPNKFQKIPQGEINRWDESYNDAPLQFKFTFENRPYYFFATHQPFGFHKNSKYEYNLTTIVREPFARVKSHYTYNCIRADKSIDIEEFKEFFRNDVNINVSAKQLSGFGNECENLAEIAIENLRQYFHSFCTLKSMHKLEEYYLTLFGLPNILSDKLNSSKSIKEEAKVLDSFKDEILNLNSEDVKLYEYVKVNERIPNIVKEKKHSHVVIIHEVDNTKKSLGKSLIQEAKSLINFINTNNIKHLGEFFVD